MNPPTEKGKVFEVFATMIGAGLVALIIWDVAILLRATQGDAAPVGANFEARQMARGAVAGATIVTKLTLEGIVAKLVYLMVLVGMSKLTASAGDRSTTLAPATSSEAAGPSCEGTESATKSAPSVVDGKREGEWTFWHGNDESAIKSKGSYRGGRQEGRWTYWHPNGQKEAEGTFTNDKADGAWTHWYPNGQKKSEGTLKDGKKEGVWSTWDQQSNALKTETYKSGELVK